MVQYLDTSPISKGYLQEEGVDYDETFSPVVKHTTVRLVLALATNFGWTIKQLDVKNAFLHGFLSKEVYMQQPLDFVNYTSPHLVCRLHKSLYGLKQAPHAWNQRFTTHVLGLGFQQSQSDSSLFVQRIDSVVIILLLYVDDILLTGNNSVALDSLVKTLSSEFDMKDLGRLSYFLGLHILYEPEGIFVNQVKYATELLSKAGMTECKPCATPLVPEAKLLKYEGEPLADPFLFRSLVRGLQYLTFSRPDLSFPINMVCQFMHRPATLHFMAVKHILRYLKGTIEFGIQFSRGNLDLQAYSDAYWAGDPNDRRSTFGFVIFLGRNPIAWGAKK